MSGIKTIALTIGDPNGIGPEIAVKAAAQLLGSADIRVILVGDEHVIRHYGERCAAGINSDGFAASRRQRTPSSSTPSMPCPRRISVPAQIEPPQAAPRWPMSRPPSVLSGRAWRMRLSAARTTRPPSTPPAFRSPAIPALIARLTGTPEEKVFMMLVGGGLRILHATLHERIHHALARLTPELIEEAGLACAATLKQLGVANPRIGVFGINPHAGENGLFGDDDDRITAPAVARLRKAGVLAEGPVGADIILGRKDIDGFVAIYHDQGHIPVKLLAGRNASALSVGAGVCSPA